MLFCFLFQHGNSKSVTLKSFFALKQVFSPVEVFAMDRFVSKRSSSSVDLDASSLDDVRAERAAIALSVGLSWPPDRYTKQTRGRPSRQQLWERALQEHIMNHHELPHGVRLQRPAWWRPGEAIDRPLTHEELAHVKTPRAAPVTPVAALVEDEPSGSASKRRKMHVNPIARDWFLDMLDQWRRERRWDMQRCLCEVQLLCSGMFDGIDPNTPYRWKRSAPRAAPLGRRSMLTPADMTRLSEHIMQVTDVLCLSAVTIRSLVLEWLDAEGLDVHPSDWWVRNLLRGMRLYVCSCVTLPSQDDLAQCLRLLPGAVWDGLALCHLSRHISRRRSPLHRASNCGQARAMCTSNRSQACLLSRARLKRTPHPGGTKCLFLSHTLMTRPAACGRSRRTSSSSGSSARRGGLEEARLVNFARQSH